MTFTATKATFDGEEAPEANTLASSKRKNLNKKCSCDCGCCSAAKKKDNKKDNFFFSNNNKPSSKRLDNKENKYLCVVCEGDNHTYQKCYLVYGKDKDWIPKENRNKFKENMKKPLFKQRVKGCWKWTKKHRKKRSDDGVNPDA